MTNEPMAPDLMVRAMEVKYDRLLAGHATSPTLWKIWRDPYGDDFPDNAEPLRYVTLTDLHRIAVALGVGPGVTIVDLGSGGRRCGWPGRPVHTLSASISRRSGLPTRRGA